MKFSGCFLHVVIKVFRWKKIKQSPEKKSKPVNRRHPPIAQLVERRTVEKLISLGPWFESGSADDIIYCLITIAGNFFTFQNWNFVGKSNIVRIQFENSIKILPLVWLDYSKEQRKIHWIMKNFYETFCMFSFSRSQGFKWQMIKQDWRKNRSGWRTDNHR